MAKCAALVGAYRATGTVPPCRHHLTGTFTVYELVLRTVLANRTNGRPENPINALGRQGQGGLPAAAQPQAGARGVARCERAEANTQALPAREDARAAPLLQL